MRRKTDGGIAAEHSHELGAERPRCGHEGRHHAEEGMRRPDLEHGPQWLLRTSSGEFGQGRFHGLDEVAHREQLANVGFVEQEHGGGEAGL